MRIRKSLRLAAVTFAGAIAFGLAAVACGGDDNGNGTGATGGTGTGTAAPTATAGNGSTGGESLSGTISMEGSSTVQPVTLVFIEAFLAENPDVRINQPSGLGSGAGITAFINGDVEIAQSSRDVRDNEIDQASAQGLDLYETRIFNDALAVVVHPSNSVEELTLEQVARIFAGEIRDWSEVGGEAGSITVYTRNEESGTFAFLEEEVIQAVLGSDAEYAQDVNKLANAPTGLTQVSNDASGIFYAGLGNLTEIPEGAVKPLRIAGESGEAVEPSLETVNSGAYPIVRGLFYYTDGEPAQSDNEVVAAFIDFALSPAGQAIGLELGFLPVGPTE